MAYNTTNIDTCMDQCTLFNTAIGNRGGKEEGSISCWGITWQGDLNEVMENGRRANCWLVGIEGLRRGRGKMGTLVASAEIVGG